MQAFQLSSQFMVSEFMPASDQQVPGKHQQLVISALHNLGPVLASEGYAPCFLAVSSSWHSTTVLFTRTHIVASC